MGKEKIATGALFGTGAILILIGILVKTFADNTDEVNAFRRVFGLIAIGLLLIIVGLMTLSPFVGLGALFLLLGVLLGVMAGYTNVTDKDGNPFIPENWRLTLGILSGLGAVAAVITIGIMVSIGGG